MWRKSGNKSAGIDSGFAPLAVMGEFQGSPLVRVSYFPVDPQINKGTVRVKETATIAPQSGNTYSFTVEESIAVVTTIVVNGTAYTPATDINNMAIGEFAYDPYTSQVTFTATEDRQSLLFVQVYGEVPTVSSDIVSPSYPDIIDSLPLEGEIEWSQSLEQHPSGGISLIVTGDAESIKQQLQSGVTISLFGCPLVINSPQFKETRRGLAPQGEVRVTAQLTGKWEYYTGLPAFLLGEPTVAELTQGSSNSESTSTACSLNKGKTKTVDRKKSTTISELARQVGASLTASTIEIKIPANTEKSATVNWDGELRSRSRVNGGFVDYNSSTIQVKNIDSVGSWQYDESQLWSDVDIRFGNAVSKPTASLGNWRANDLSVGDFDTTARLPTSSSLRQEDLAAYAPAVWYTSSRVTGDLVPQFESDNGEDLQGKAALDVEPKWNRRSPVRKRLISGDTEPDRSPGSPRSLTVNADISGITKRYVETWTTDGYPDYELEIHYGWMFTGKDFQSGNVTWGIVQYKQTTFNYDPETGYELGYTYAGYKMVRHKVEIAYNPETIDLDPSNDDDAKRLELYEFKQAPLSGGKYVELAQFRDYYGDFEVEPPYEIYEYCKQDGTVGHGYALVPGWVEPMFVLKEVEWVNAYSEIVNPDSTADRRLPPYTGGEESYTARIIQPSPAEYQPFTSEVISPAMYREYNVSFKAQDANFGASALDSPFTDYFGTPAEAPRRKSLYEKESVPSEESISSSTSASQEIDVYYLKSGGYDGPPVGTINFNGAKTGAEVLTAAKTDLFLKNLTAARSETFTIPFNYAISPGDKFTYTANGMRRHRRVTAVKNSLLIQGRTKSDRLVTGKTQVTLGEDRDLQVQLTAVRSKKDTVNAEQPGDTLQIFLPVYKVGRTLGYIPASPTTGMRY